MKKRKLDLYGTLLPSSMDILKLSDTLEHILGYLKDIEALERVHITLLERNMTVISMVGSAGKGIKTSIRLMKKEVDKKGPINHIISSNKRYEINTIDERRSLGINTKKTGSLYSYPLKGSNKDIGIISFVFKEKNTSIDIDKMVEDIGNIIFISYSIYSLEKRIVDFSSISDISKEMVTSDIDKLLKMVVLKAMNRVDATSASIMLLKDDTLETRYAYGKGIRKNFREIRFKLGEGAAGKVAKTKRQILIKNKLKDDRYIDTGKRTYMKNSYLGIPLIYNEKVEGVLNIDFKSTKLLTEDCIEFLNILASSASVAIRNTQLYSSRTRKVKRLSAVYDITKAISATLDLEKVLDYIVIKIIKIVNSKVCSVYLLNKEGTHLLPKSVYNMSGRFLKRGSIPLKESLSGEAIKTKKAVYCENIQSTDKFNDKAFAKKEGVNSFLSIPLVIENHGIGVINIYSRDKKIYSQDEIDLLMSFADQAAIAIEKAILYRRIKSDKERIGKVLEISHEISSELDFDKLLGRILKRAISLTDSQAGSLLLVEGETLYVYDSIGYSQKKTENLRLKIGDGITGHVAKTGKALIVDNVTKDKRFLKLLPYQKSEAAFPILIRDRVFGVLNLDSTKTNNYEKHKETLLILMDRIAAAIENSWLHKKTENFNRKLKSEVMIATKNLLEANKRLLKMDEIKSDFVSNVSHELRTPLTSIIGYSKLMVGERLGPLNEQQQKAFDVIIGESERLTRLINDLLDLSKLEKGAMNLKIEEGNICEIVENVVDLMKSIADEKQIKIKVENERCEKILFDPDAIKQVLNNLLSNAIKFTSEGGEVRVSTKDMKNYVEVSVEDTGRGIAKKQIPKLFDKFYQVDPSLTKITAGTGLGLPIALHIIKKHLGDIKVKSALGKGSTFTFTISKKLKKVTS